MYSLKVIAHSASKKSILATVSKQVGIFSSVIATGNIAVPNVDELPAIGSTNQLPGITKVSVNTQVIPDSDKNFNWLVLE
jgi:hypothetical protein